MKKIYIIVAFFLSLVNSGCNEWLTIEPENDLIKEEYWQSKEDVEGVLASAYASLSVTSYELFHWAEIRGGDIALGDSPTSDKINMFDFNIFPENALTKWEDFYEAINYANTLLEFAPGVLEIDPAFSVSELKALEAEATFIRSLCYFNLVKAFRDVPMVLEAYVDDTQEVTVTINSEAEIIAQILSDLESVRPYAPISFEVDDYSDNHNKGRATQHAVDALLADIYLWDNQYDKCISYCDNVISSFDFALVDGNDYFSLYSPGNSLESIFEIQSDVSLGQINTLFYYTANFSGGSSDVSVSQYFIEKMGLTDLRGNGVSFDSSTNSIWKYIGYEGGDTSNARTASSQSDANWIVYRLAELYLMKAEAYFELQDLNQTKAMLNVIRGRAGLDTSYAIDDSELLQTIIDERSREFIGEGKRWFDLVRIARRDVSGRKNLLLDAVLLNVSPQYFVAVKSKISDPDSWFLPIYYKELEVNNLLEQNPFYVK